MEHKGKTLEKPKNKTPNPCEFYVNGGLPCILLAGNDPREMRGHAKTLEGKYNIALARTGDEAFAKLEAMDRTDLVLADMDLDMDTDAGAGEGGFAWRFARNDDYSHLPALYMAGPECEKGFLDKMGGINFIQKPFKPELLALKAREMLLATKLAFRQAFDECLREAHGQDAALQKGRYLAVLELSQDEANILGWLRDGLTGREICERLGRPREMWAMRLTGRHEHLFHQNRPCLLERLVPPPNGEKTAGGARKKILLVKLGPGTRHKTDSPGGRGTDT